MTRKSKKQIQFFRLLVLISSYKSRIDVFGVVDAGFIVCIEYITGMKKCKISFIGDSPLLPIRLTKSCFETSEFFVKFCGNSVADLSVECLDVFNVSLPAFGINGEEVADGMDTNYRCLINSLSPHRVKPKENICEIKNRQQTPVCTCTTRYIRVFAVCHSLV